MATEYTKIGRIRPVFKGAWNSAAAYTILDIVHTADGSRAYAAVKDVPAGTQLTNTAYWQPVIDMQALVSRVEQAEENVSTAVSAVSGKAPAIECSASGNPVNVSDSADAPLLGLKLFGKTTQDGIPTIETYMPLKSPGEDGKIDIKVIRKNLQTVPYYSSGSENEVTIDGVTFTVSEDGSITANGTATASAATFYLNNKNSPLFTLKTGEKYIISGCPSGAAWNTYYLRASFDSSNVSDTGNGAEFVAGEINYAYIAVRQGVTVSNVVFRPMIRLASITDDAYEPYLSNNTASIGIPNGFYGIPVSDGGNHTDLNGQQWLCNEIDFERGVYIQRVGKYAIKGTETWTKLGAGVTSGLHAYQSGILGILGNQSHSANARVGLCSHAVNLNSYGKTDDTVYFGNSLTITVSDLATLEDWKTFIAEQYAAGTPVTVLYKLATPIETQLSDAEKNAYAALHTNKTCSVFLTDSGVDMQVEYVVETKTYIDKAATNAVSCDCSKEIWYTSLAMFEKIGVIGDSYASGLIFVDNGDGTYTKNNYYNLSWGQVLARRNGVAVTNFSRGGLDTRTWLTDSKGLTLMQSTEAQNLYILALGINDIAIGADYLGTIADITDDYHSNPDTFYGNYARIIEQIMEHAPNAKIIISTMAGATEDHSNFNAAIKNIANHYGFPCIEQRKDDFFLSSFYTDSMVYRHPTAAGYAGMALALERLIVKCILDNYTYFTDYVG